MKKLALVFLFVVVSFAGCRSVVPVMAVMGEVTIRRWSATIMNW